MVRFFTFLCIAFLLSASSCNSVDLSEESLQVETDAYDLDAELKDDHHDDEPRPFDSEANAWADLNTTLMAAKTNGKMSLVVMGANWCHDSRGLASHFEDTEFRTQYIDPYYEQVYIDVGEKDRNIDIAHKFGLEAIVGTPTVFFVTSDGDVLNLDDATGWRNSASRSREDIIASLLSYTKQ